MKRAPDGDAAPGVEMEPVDADTPPDVLVVRPRPVQEPDGPGPKRPPKYRRPSPGVKSQDGRGT